MTRRGLLLFALLSVVWGLPYLLIKVAVAEVSIPFLVFSRAGIGAIALMPLAMTQGGWNLLVNRRLAVASFCLVEMIVPWALIAHGEHDVPSSVAGLLIALTPGLTVIAARLLGSGTPLSARRGLGLVFGFIGVVVLAQPAGGAAYFGMAEIVLAAACYAVGSVIASKWLSDIPPATLTAACLAVVALVYAPSAATEWPTVMPSIAALMSIAGLGLFCTALAFAVFFLLVREIGPERATVITYVAPAVAVASGVFLLSEPLGSSTLVAFALVLGGSYLATARNAGGLLKPRTNILERST